MSPEQWRKVDTILRAALALPSDERAAHVAQACAGDGELRREVESLLAVEVPDDFLELPAVDAGTALIARLSAALAGRYLVERELGRGGMATVFVALDLRHRRHVAIKVLDPEFGTRVAPSRFAREVETAAGLNHPHVLPLHDSGESDGLLYYVMPFVTGGSLRDRLQEGGPLSVPETVRIVRAVAGALDYAHRRGVVHRDIKPENLLLDDEGHVLVADFGIARGIQRMPAEGDASRGTAETLTQTGVMVGTPAYISPEQAVGGGDIDGRSDQYSLGCVAFELLAGALPFAGSSAEQVSRRLTEAPASILARRPDLPEAAHSVLTRVLALSPGARFPTTIAFADALGDALMSLSTSARASEPGAIVSLASNASTDGHAPFSRSPITRRRAIGAVAVGLALLAIVWQVWGPATRKSVSTTLPSLAVLPLKNFSGDTTQDYFSAGLTDEVTTTLARIAGLRVIDHQSVRQFANSDRPVKEIARLLGVQHVVTGSVLRDNNGVRITASLIDPPTNTQVWTERFEQKPGNVIALQRDVALAIARAIEVTLTPKERERLAEARDVDPAVFELYVKGTQERYKAFGPAEHKEVSKYFERAIALDSTYAPAYAGLAALHMHTGEKDSARVLAAKAITLDSTLAEAHTVLGLIKQLYEMDWAGAESSFVRAIREKQGYVEAHHELSMLLMRQKRFGEAISEASHTVILSPMTARFVHGLGEVYLYAGRHADALVQAEKALAMDSTGGAHFLRAAVLLQLNRSPEAEQVLVRCIPLGCGDDGRALLGYLYAISGQHGKAQRVLDTLIAKSGAGKGGNGIPNMIAEVLAGMGRKSRALEWLEQGVGTNVHSLYLAIDPAFDSLRTEPRFHALMKRMGLPE